MLIRFFFKKVPEDDEEFIQRFSEALWLEERYLKFFGVSINNSVMSIFGGKK